MEEKAGPTGPGSSHVDIVTLLMHQAAPTETWPDRTCCWIEVLPWRGVRDDPGLGGPLVQDSLEVVPVRDGGADAAVLVREVVAALCVQVFEMRVEVSHLSVVFGYKIMPVALLLDKTPSALRTRVSA